MSKISNKHKASWVGHGWSITCRWCGANTFVHRLHPFTPHDAVASHIKWVHSLDLRQN